MNKELQEKIKELNNKLNICLKRKELLEYHKQGLISAEEMARLAMDERYLNGLKSLEEAS